jgi:hypothetical protein
MKADYGVIYYDSLIGIVERVDGKWSLLAQIIPQGIVLDMFQCGKFLITH